MSRRGDLPSHVIDGTVQSIHGIVKIPAITDTLKCLSQCYGYTGLGLGFPAMVYRYRDSTSWGSIEDNQLDIRGTKASK